MKWLGAILVSLSAATAAAQSVPSSIPIHVSETGGIRRTQFPVAARIPFPRAVLRDPAAVRLLSNQNEVPSQASVEARWPDGSIQWLVVELNVTIGPGESQTYALQYGEGVKSEAVARGLTVTEDADAIQIGNLRFNKSGSPLVASISMAFLISLTPSFSPLAVRASPRPAYAAAQDLSRSIAFL